MSSVAASADPAESGRFRHWQRRTLIATMIGYAAYYFVRKNLSIAMPAIQADLGITKSDLGLFLTLHGLIYGVSKFANGFLGDRANARYFMIAGLLLSALANVVFGFSSAVLMLGFAWVINGWVQGMGFPPCARLMTHWYHPKELATKMSVWNTSHSIGAGLVVIACGYIVGFGWRWAFFGPAMLVTLVCVFLWFALRDTPSSVGLPEIKITDDAGQETSSAPPADFKRFVRKQVFGNPYIWIIAFANFFVYTFRYGVLDWGPTLLTESKGISLNRAGWMVATFEIAGILGMLATGWLTDRVFGGRGSRTCVFCMSLAGLFLFLFWKLSVPPFIATILLGGAGFFIYGPQALVGITVANLATKHAAGTAVGFTGLFGYLSTILSGWGLGYLAQHYSWNLALGALVGTAVIGTILFLLAWPAKAHGYGQMA